ncbi:group III truncated hemoglobin [Aquimarina gracilis]|uniref:Group III truncated hemoglobin n=1 Tax=Aquimarina gracilis TaxID=874422 RepID=A0ABU5ZTH8_9FLAO|nr:group III truncated hemoglobin [Aquimarina gracilis]MEB3344928.1 group III truncated hemoglobin [Aquimarina gracilis]
MKDIENRADIEFLMRSFYKEAFNDSAIGEFFTKIAKLDLEEHLPHITDFWEQQLFRKGDYKKNVLQIHKGLSEKKSFEKLHFERWLFLLDKTVDQNFEGEKANLIKTRALSIATVMQLKTV